MIVWSMQISVGWGGDGGVGGVGMEEWAGVGVYAETAGA